MLVPGWHNHEFLPMSAVDLKLHGDRNWAVIRLWRVNQFVRKARDRGRIEIESSGEVDREWTRQSQTNGEENRRPKQPYKSCLSLRPQNPKSPRQEPGPPVKP